MTGVPVQYVTRLAVFWAAALLVMAVDLRPAAAQPLQSLPSDGRVVAENCQPAGEVAGDPLLVPVQTGRCRPGYFACGGGCCPNGTVCRGRCCLPPGHTQCAAGSCASCRTGTTCCGRVCCRRGTACQNGCCVPRGYQLCAGQGCRGCPTGTSCCGRRCCPRGWSCAGGRTCRSASWPGRWRLRGQLNFPNFGYCIRTWDCQHIGPPSMYGRQFRLRQTGTVRLRGPLTANRDPETPDVCHLPRRPRTRCQFWLETR